MSKDLTETLREAFTRFSAQDLAGTERLCRGILDEAPGNPNALHLLGVVRLLCGSASEAIELLAEASQRNPFDPVIFENLGVAYLALAEHRKAETAFRHALGLGAAGGSLYMRLGLALASQRKLPEAVNALRTAAERAPADSDAHLNLGNALAEQGHAEEALACYRKVLELRPDHVDARFNTGTLYRRLGRLEDAASAFKSALAVAPDYADAHHGLGAVYEQQGRLDEAVSCYREALAFRPDHISSLNNLGNALVRQGRREQAVVCYEQAIQIRSDHPDAYVNLGNVRAEEGRYADARALYETALRLDPRSFDAHHNLGRMLKVQRRLDEAIAHYHQALALSPDQAVTHNELGNAYRESGDLERAIACFRKAIAADPGHVHAYYNLAETFKLQGRLDEAITLYEDALARKPDLVQALGGLIYVRQQACRWQGIEELWGRMRRDMFAIPGATVSPFSVLSFSTSAREQLACAGAWARQELGPLAGARAGLGFNFPAPRAKDRITVGYLSWDFHRHATSYLIAELFELHDRARFEVLAYSFGPDDGSAIRARIRNACDRFVDVANESYVATAQRIYRDGVDILVDLKGYTQGSRPQIAALRPAPVQVNWLGFPGTMGTEYMDYIIADPFIIPAGMERCYAEKVVRLPDCYQINDRRREAGERTPTREECGLPGEGFVFCCFNQTYKILPDVFRLWTRIMRAVPGSVLWLMETNPWAVENLRQAAAAQGVAPGRLAFAPRKPLAEHLARYRSADLAIDTFPYTSHTTASDALWMGCPLVTCTGETFASRVAGSILINAGMRELVTDNFSDYERAVIELATSPERLRDIRRRLQEVRDSCPLFDTPRFVRNLERAYEEMLDAYTGGGAPKDGV